MSQIDQCGLDIVYAGVGLSPEQSATGANRTLASADKKVNKLETPCGASVYLCGVSFFGRKYVESEATIKIFEEDANAVHLKQVQTPLLMACTSMGGVCF